MSEVMDKESSEIKSPNSNINDEFFDAEDEGKRGYKKMFTIDSILCFDNLQNFMIRFCVIHDGRVPNSFIALSRCRSFERFKLSLA